MRRATYYLNSGREVDIHVDNNVFIAQDGYLDQKHTFDHFPTWQEVSACIIHYCPDELCNESGEPL